MAFSALSDPGADNKGPQPFFASKYPWTGISVHIACASVLLTMFNAPFVLGASVRACKLETYAYLVRNLGLTVREPDSKPAVYLAPPMGAALGQSRWIDLDGQSPRHKHAVRIAKKVHVGRFSHC